MAKREEGLGAAASTAVGPSEWLEIADALYSGAVLLQRAHRVNLDRAIELQDTGRPAHEIRLAMKDSDVGTPAFMLLGLAIENLLKGLLTTRLIGPPRTHDLRRLASLAEVRLTSTEDEAIGRLSVFVEWAGRYPLSTKAKLRTSGDVYWSRLDLRTLNDFCWRLRTLLAQATQTDTGDLAP